MTSRRRGFGEWMRWQLESPMRFVNGLLLVMAVLAYTIGVFKPDWHGMSENLTAEVFGVWLAVVIINTILRNHQEKRDLPARVEALRRIRAIHHEISRFWMSLVLHAANVDGLRQAILDLDDLKLFDERLANAINQLDFNTEPHTLVPEPMSSFVSKWASTIQRKIETVTQGYARYLSPQMVAVLDHVENNPFIVNLAGNVDQRLTAMAALHDQPNFTAPESWKTVMWRVIGSHWYEDFIPAINDLGQAIAEEIQLLTDAGADEFDRPSPSDHQIRMTVGRAPPPAEHFDPDCEEELRELRQRLRLDLYQSQQEEATND